MLDAKINAALRPALDRAGASLARAGIGADHVTLAGGAVSLLACLSVALGWLLGALALLALSRLLDGLDGAVARASLRTDRGGFLDIALDYVLYAGLPLAFAVLEPAYNALPAAALLAAFLLNGTAFLAFAALALRRGLATSAQGPKSFYFMAGFAEGFETIAVFAAACLFPAAFPWLAWGFAALCLASAVSRILTGWRMLA